MNILIIGLGSIARKHITVLRSLKEDFKIYALRSKLNSKPEEDVVNVYDLDDMKVVFDFAIISNPTYMHDEYIEKLALKGISLFIEKPAIHNLKNSERLNCLIREKNIFTYVACNLRFHPCLTFLKNVLEERVIRINEVNVYCGSFLPEWRPGKDFKTIYSANASMGGGVHLDLFHELDYTIWLFGFPLKSKSVLKSKSSLGIDAIDYANYIFEYESFTANITLNYYRRDPKRNIELVLEEETWNIDLINNIILGRNQTVIYSNSNFSIAKSYYDQMSYFLTHLNSKSIPMNSFQESTEILKLCLNNGSIS